MQKTIKYDFSPNRAQKNIFSFMFVSMVHLKFTRQLSLGLIHKTHKAFCHSENWSNF